MKIFEAQIKNLVLAAINEDIKGGDITTDAIASANDPVMTCTVTAKKPTVICGLPVFKMVMDEIAGKEEGYKINFHAAEGESVQETRKVISVTARASYILYAERTALNFLQHMSGIANASALASRELDGLKTRVLDTRKTLPGLRLLQKYAVKTGGGENHRFDLSSGILIKDNHIKLAGGIKSAVNAVKKYYSGPNLKIEVETSCLEEVKEAIEAAADVIMLDNMDLDLMEASVKIIAGKALSEASGNIGQSGLRMIASKTGVDYISMGSLTNAVMPADFSLNFELN